MNRRPRSPGVVLACIAMALSVLIAVFALTTRQQPPPTIAEFAPQALEQITQAPTDQSSDAGVGDGSGSETPGTDGQSVGVDRPIEVPRVRRCIGDPPRQIEDPQSPPCVPYWSGDNGGASWKGVTRDEIAVAYPDSNESRRQTAQGFFDFFNRRFEFYGRKLVLRGFPAAQGGNATSTVLQADAVKADEEKHSFASLGYDLDANKGGQFAYYDELARRKVMSFSYFPNYTSPTHLEDREPYQWVHFPDFAQFQQHQGEWMCRALQGRPARYAGAGSSGSQRVFGLIREESTGGEIAPDMTVLRDALARCGARFAVDVRSDGSVTSAQTIMLQMRQNTPSVTTVLCVCDGSGIGYHSGYMRSSSNQSYFPEWLVSNYIYQDADFVTGNLWPKEQSEHAFGIDFRNKQLAEADMAFRWAQNEIDYQGGNPGFDQTYWVYLNALQIATAVQLAGPRLTPDAVQAGLFKSTFPNPGCRGGPYYQACVGYAVGDRSMQGDGTIMWWSNTERAPSSPQPGTYCYARSGTRYTRGSWPADDDMLFESSCR